MAVQKGDYLSRERELEELERIVLSVSRMGKGRTFAVNGKWGSGKTFFLKMFLQDMEQIQKEETASDWFLAIYYDCWENNYYQEPVIPMLSTVLGRLREEIEFLGGKGIPEGVRGAYESLKKCFIDYGGRLAESKLGVDPVRIWQALKETGRLREEERFSFDCCYSLRQSLTAVREQLKTAAEERTLLFVVDELDRCLPEYAIRVLENIHHVFSGIENVVVILAIDQGELEQVIRTAYGEKIDAERYLRKIIDFYFQLGVGEPDEGYVEKYMDYKEMFCGTEEEEREAQKVLRMMMEGLDIRTQEKIWEKAEVIHHMIAEEKMDLSCLVFEILVLTKEAWGKEAEDKWKNLFMENEKRQRYLMNGKAYMRIEEGLMERVRWYWEKTRKGRERAGGGLCGEFFWQDWAKWEESVGKMREFCWLEERVR